MKKEIFSNRIGAWFVVRSTCASRFTYCWPAIMGIAKYAGCVEFHPAKHDRMGPYWEDGVFFPRNKSLRALPYGQIALRLTEHYCRQMFSGFPAVEEAWLVYPDGIDHWAWEHVDVQLERQR